ncbi:MAG TPA: hypothetical protein VGA37_10465 [Gemmatimonadales bacterium]
MNYALIAVIQRVRRRWRMRLAMRGVAIVVGAGLLMLLFSAYGMDRLRFTPTAVTVFQLLTYGCLIGLAVAFLVRPLRRRVTDQQVALYLEEHEPSLDGQVVSAIEFDRSPSAHRSHALVQQVVERAMQRCAAIDGGRRVEHDRLVRSGGYLAGASIAALAVFLLNPGFLRHATPFLLAPWGGGSTESPYSIAVTPGDSLVARGADLRITAILHNFDAATVAIAIRPGGADAWERWSMVIEEETGGYQILLFDLTDSTEYFVEAEGVRSAMHRIAVADLPYVATIALEYHFPRYTGLSPQRQEESGDIAALAGTRVEVEVTPTFTVARGALAAGADTIPLAAAPNGTMIGELTVRREGSYRVLLEAPDGRMVSASPEYFIDLLADQPPRVTFERPGRDVAVTAVDEVFLEARAEDDFGLRALDLVYSINGGPEQTIALFGGGRERKQVTAAHTIYLEEIALQPGDFLSYYSRARDTRPDGEPATTDIYFVSIRPFDQTFRQAEQQGGGGGGGMSVGELSQRQKEVIAATFKLVRDRAATSDKDFRDNIATLTLAQGRLREEVETLVQRIESRGVVQLDSTFASVARELPQAVEAMSGAEQQLGLRDASAALPPERKALQHLQRAEAAFREQQVSRGQQNGGGGGQPAASAEDLADLFELELDRMRNQYEEVQRGQREQVTEQVDETLEKLRELARRQQQENERMRAQAQRGNQPSGGGGRGQRRLADEAAELARQLERLSREQSLPELGESARRLDEAVEAMRRAAAQGNSGAAQGNRALDQLREARRNLEGSRAAGLQRDLATAQRRAARLAEQQRDVARDVERLPSDRQARDLAVRRLIDRKEQMAEEVRDLESEIDRLARDARGDQPDAARELRGAANELRDTRLRDKILYSRGVVRERDRAFARNFEEQIQTDITELGERLAEAAGQIGESREQRLGRSLDRTRDVATAIESLGERLREAQDGAEQQGRARQGQEGAPDQEGQPGQGAGPGNGRRLDPQAQRQFQRELRERRGDLQQLREQLQQDGVDVSQLDAVMRNLGRFDNQGAIGDPRGIERLQTEIVQGIKEFEYALRRQILGSDADRLFLSGSDETPAEYREMVEEYYRRLAERRR